MILAVVERRGRYWDWGINKAELDGEGEVEMTDLRSGEQRWDLHCNPKCLLSSRRCEAFGQVLLQRGCAREASKPALCDWLWFHSLGAAAAGCSWAPRWKCRDVALQQCAAAGYGMGEGRRGITVNHYFFSWHIKLGAKTDSASLLHTMCSIIPFLM